MKFDRLAAILLGVVIVLLIPTGIIVKNDLQDAKQKTENIFIPEIIFKENIRFPLDLEEINPHDYVSKIIDTDKTDFDEVKTLQFSLNKIGEKTGIISLVQKGRVGEKTFKYEVYDDIMPIIRELETPVTEVGNVLDLTDYFVASDNSIKEDETMDLTIDGYVNYDVAGTYAITVYAEDDSGNRAELNSIVTVTAPEPIAPTPEVPSTPAETPSTPSQPNKPQKPVDKEPEDETPREEEKPSGDDLLGEDEENNENQEVEDAS